VFDRLIDAAIGLLEGVVVGHIGRSCGGMMPGIVYIEDRERVQWPVAK
jgi:hypothetical protein